MVITETIIYGDESVYDIYNYCAVTYKTTSEMMKISVEIAFFF